MFRIRHPNLDAKCIEHVNVTTSRKMERIMRMLKRHFGVKCRRGEGSYNTTEHEI